MILKTAATITGINAIPMVIADAEKNLREERTAEKLPISCVTATITSIGSRAAKHNATAQPPHFGPPAIVIPRASQAGMG
jgi:hypothetical protein